jgi:hypothetical protein
MAMPLPEVIGGAEWLEEQLVFCLAGRGSQHELLSEPTSVREGSRGATWQLRPRPRQRCASVSGLIWFGWECVVRWTRRACSQGGQTCRSGFLSGWARPIHGPGHSFGNGVRQWRPS